MTSSKDQSHLLYCTITVSVCATLSFLWLMHTLEVSSDVLIQNIVQSFHRPRKESFFGVGRIGEWAVYIYLYGIILTSILIMFFYRWLQGFQKRDCTDSPSYPRTAFLISLIVFFISTGLQTFTHAKHFFSEIEQFSGQSLSKKKYDLFKWPYAISLHCRAHFPGKHRSTFITDLDVARDPAMTFHRRLAYHLYPIDIRNIRTDQPVDCYTIVCRENAESAIPEGVQNVFPYDQFSIFAIIGEAE